MIYYGLSPSTQILAIITVVVVVLDLVLGVVASILVRKIAKMQSGINLEAHETIRALKCCSNGSSNCKDCPLKYYSDCGDRLVLASYQLTTDQQRLIAKYGKIFMK